MTTNNMLGQLKSAARETSERIRRYLDSPAPNWELLASEVNHLVLLVSETIKCQEEEKRERRSGGDTADSAKHSVIPQI